MNRVIACAVSSTFLTAVGITHAGATMPNGLSSTVIEHATISIDDVAARGGMRGGGMGGMTGLKGGMGGKGGMAGGMGGMGGVVDGGGARKGGAGMGGMAGALSGKGANIKNTNVRNTNVRNTNVQNTNVNVVRPVRAWAPQPYYGTVIAGATLGTMIVATKVAVAPPPPAANLCWFWADPAMTRGYWDYCKAP
jgi:hypothetical protein